MKCGCDPHIEYCDICFPPEKRRSIVKPRNGKPLTIEEITAIVQSMSAYTWDVYMLARQIEKAHGIGE